MLNTSPGQFAGNDLFGGAIEVSGATGAVADIYSRDSNVIRYTVEPGEPVETGIATGWWQWTAPSDGRFTWRMDGNPAFQLTFFTGDAVDDLQFAGSLVGGSTFILDANDNTRYWIAVGRSPESIGSVLDQPEAFQWGPTPANDERTTASPIMGSSGSVDARLDHATNAADDPPDTVGTDSVWWHWRAPTSGWQRFWVAGHPLSTMLAVYPDSASTQAVADSERSFLANGRVELHLLAEAGRTYDIRLSSRPGVLRDPSATILWEASDAPATLAYKGAVTLESLAANPLANGFRSPRSLVMSDDGHYLFSTAYGGVFAFARDNETGDIAPAYRALAESDDHGALRDALRRGRLWWHAPGNRLIAHTDLDVFSYALPEDGSNMRCQGPKSP